MLTLKKCLQVLKCFRLENNVEARLVVGRWHSLSPLLSWEMKSVLGHKSNGLRDMKESLRNADTKMRNERHTLGLITYFCIALSQLPIKTSYKQAPS